MHTLAILALLPALAGLKPDYPSIGPPDAPVSVMAWMDFTSADCANFSRDLARLRINYPVEVRIVFRHLANEDDADAFLAAEAAMAAHAQRKFWAMYDWIFADPNHLVDLKVGQYPTDMGLDLAKFKADLEGHAFKGAVEADANSAVLVDARAPPTAFVNGKPLPANASYDLLQNAVDAELYRLHRTNRGKAMVERDGLLLRKRIFLGVAVAPTAIGAVATLGSGAALFACLGVMTYQANGTSPGKGETQRAYFGRLSAYADLQGKLVAGALVNTIVLSWSLALFTSGMLAAVFIATFVPPS